MVAGQSCDGGLPVIGKPHEKSGVGIDASTEPIVDVVTIDSGCATGTTRGKLRPSNLLFIIDRSGSMACNLPKDGQSSEVCESNPTPLFPDLPSKWSLTKSALKNTINELRIAGNVRLAMALFPETGTRCTVSMEPDIPFSKLDEASQESVLNELDAVIPFGKTPLAGATILSYASILEKMREGKLDGETFVVLVTDGYETCKTDELKKLVESDVLNAREQLGVRTFVIGAPGSESGRALLSEIAISGGTAAEGCQRDKNNCHFDMTESLDFSGDLLRILTLVNAEALACTIEIPSAKENGSVNLEEVNVIVNGESRVMKNDGACSKVNGWRYASDYSSIQLCGNVCRDAKKRGAEVTVILGCPTVIQ
jgi:hypothetical protein